MQAIAVLNWAEDARDTVNHLDVQKLVINVCDQTETKILTEFTIGLFHVKWSRLCNPPFYILLNFGTITDLVMLISNKLFFWKLDNCGQNYEQL